ncbi:MAG: hypothetical protein ACRDTA_18675 [Pseudonocardiaceae bacterium]
MAVATALAVLPVMGLTVAAATPAQAAGCTVNHYRVNHTPAGVWEWDSQRWIRDKQKGDHVTGPNRSVVQPNSKDWWAVYLGGGGIGRMWHGYLDYLYCD